MIKIGITGTESTGKTTLGNALKEHYNDSIFMTESARQFDKNILSYPDTQYRILIEQLLGELISSKCNYDYFITDRTLVDNLVYLTYFSGYNKLVYDLVRHWIKTYNIIFFSPIENIPFEYDEFRHKIPGLRNLIEYQLKEFYKNNYIEYHELTGNVEERLEQAIKIIDSVKQ